MILWLKRLWRWLVAVIRWIVRPWWWVVVTLGLLVEAFLIPYKFSFPVEPCVRLTGLAFQLLGLWTVARGLGETRKLFDRPNWTTFIAQWWRDSPRVTPRATAFADAQTRVRIRAPSPEDGLEVEARSRELVDQRLQKQLEEFAAGGLHLESIGLLWILMGVTLATASVEIAWLLKRLM
jgi:hypothetical protein